MPSVLVVYLVVTPVSAFGYYLSDDLKSSGARYTATGFDFKTRAIVCGKYVLVK